MSICTRQKPRLLWNFSSLIVSIATALALPGKPVRGNTCEAKRISVPSVCGRVLTLEGPPLSSAEVKLVDTVSERIIQTTATDEDGRFKFADIEKGEYRLFVSAPHRDLMRWPLRVTQTNWNTCPRMIVVSLAVYNGMGCRSSVTVKRSDFLKQKATSCKTF
jgi:hypothetical protein